MGQQILRRDFLKIAGISSASVFFSGYGIPVWADEARKQIKPENYPFIFGAQYYRAPTPEPELWKTDLARMREMGFTDVKFWVQWRWSHHQNDHFNFDDLDTLMSLAEQSRLRVTLNTIFDVAPVWLYDKYPDAKQVKNNGDTIEPYIVGHRQIGGYPGPCYNHPGALEERKKFMKVLVNHFKGNKALAMWDVWNEPELSYPQRKPSVENLACYCEHCQSAFRKRMQEKYLSIGKLNQIWGRNYDDWGQVEVPRSTETFRDFIDWREFHIETMSREAKWRLDFVRSLDPHRIHYLHVVPNTLEPFNPVSTCADDFEMAELCDVFAATMNNGPFFTPQVISAGNGKICYNVESHINGGNTNMHQAVVDLPDLLNDFLPQIGMGIKGFLFWQYRPEVLGIESPAWGLTNLDGSDRAVTKATQTFWNKISPIKKRLMNSFPKPAQIGIWKSRKNEIFHFCLNNNFNSIAKGTNAYAEFFYWNSYNYRYISGEMLENGELDEIRLLILPSCYYLTEQEATVLDKWIGNGGVAITEAHLGGYNGTSGRHSHTIPGAGLAEKWNLFEKESVASFRLKLDQEEILELNVTEDTKKLLKDFGMSGAKFYPIRLKSGSILWGAERYAKIASPDSTPLGWFHNDYPCIIRKDIGEGTLFYCGTNIGEGSEKGKEGFKEILLDAIDTAGIKPNLDVESNAVDVRVDALYEKEDLNYIVIRNHSEASQQVMLDISESAQGLFSKVDLKPHGHNSIPPSFCDIFIVKDKAGSESDQSEK